MDYGLVLPVSYRTGPAPWVSLSGLFVDFLSLEEKRFIFALMACFRGDVLDAAVVVVMVVRLHKGLTPVSGIFQTSKRFGRVSGCVFQGFKQGFGERVVVTYRGSTERLDHAELLQGMDQGCPSHGTAVVRMENKLSVRWYFFFETCFGKHGAGLFRGFGFVDFKPGNLSAVEIHKKIEIEKTAFHGAFQVGDIPGPKLVGACSATGFGFPGRWLLAFSPMLQLLFFSQNAVKGALACEISALIGKRWNYLLG